MSDSDLFLRLAPDEPTTILLYVAGEAEFDRDLVASDEGVGSDADLLFVLWAAADSVSGTEATALFVYRTTVESVVGVETTSVTATLPLQSDFGTVIDAETLYVHHALIETGSAVEAVGYPLVFRPAADMGAGAETAQPSAEITASETGTAIEGAGVTFADAETGSGFEAEFLIVHLVALEVFEAAEAAWVTSADIVAQETATGLDLAVVRAVLPTQADVAIGADGEALYALLAGQDSGLGGDLAGTLTALLMALETVLGSEGVRRVIKIVGDEPVAALPGQVGTSIDQGRQLVIVGAVSMTLDLPQGLLGLPPEPEKPEALLAMVESTSTMGED